MSAQNQNIERDQAQAREPDIDQQQQLQQEEVAAPKEDVDLDGVQTDPLMKVMLSSVIEGAKRIGGLATAAGLATGLLVENNKAPSAPSTGAPQVAATPIAAPQVAAEPSISPAQVQENAMASVQSLGADVMSEINQIKEQFTASMKEANTSHSVENSAYADLGDKQLGTNQIAAGMGEGQGFSMNA